MGDRRDPIAFGPEARLLHESVKPADGSNGLFAIRTMLRIGLDAGSSRLVLAWQS
jgi:hypothetical protein